MEQNTTPRWVATIRRALPFLAVAGLVALVDQATKHAIVTFIPENHAIPQGWWVQLTHITNSGSAFGLFQGQTALLVVAGLIGIFGIVAYYRANGQQSLLLRLALGLVLGGALGNLTDRVFRGAVVDFVYVQLWPDFHWPAFNVADSSLFLGLLLLGIYVLRQDKRAPKPAPVASMPEPPAPPAQAHE